MNWQKWIFLVFGLMWSVLDLSAQENWNLKLDKDGIKIFSTAHADSKIEALKVICTVESTLSQLTAVLLDIKSQDEWFYHTKSSVLQQVSPSELYYYAELYLPFPFSNRDFVEHVKVTQNADNKAVSMAVENVPDYVPPKNNRVRVTQSQCKWLITPISKNVVLVEFTLFVDPGGSIPVWLVNLFSIYGPYESFKKLKTQLKKPEYANQMLSFIRN